MTKPMIGFVWGWVGFIGGMGITVFADRFFEPTVVVRGVVKYNPGAPSATPLSLMDIM